jgi:ABC-type multidrug transport system fused ATPase/permease subunit
MQKSSFPSGRISIAVSSALFSVRKVFAHYVSLGVMATILLIVAFWRHSVGGWEDVFESLLLYLFLVFCLLVPVFLGALFSLRAQKKYLSYKIRRHQKLKRFYKDPEQQKLLNERIDYFQQHLRAIDEKIRYEFDLGIGA